MRLILELSKVYILFLIIFLISRVAFYFLYNDRFNELSLNESLLTFIYGLRMDTIVISIILVIPTLFLALAPKYFSNFTSKLLKTIF